MPSRKEINRQLQAQRQLNAIAKAYRDELMQIVQPGSGHVLNPLGIPKFHSTRRSPYSKPPAGMQFRSGVMPNDTDISKYVKQRMAGDPRVRKLKQASRSRAPRTVQLRPGEYDVNQQAAVPAEQDLFTQAFQQAAADKARAREENLARYREGHDELSGLRTRRQEGLVNLGKTQEQLNAERAAEALDSQRAMLAASGLANSNVLPAFAQRNARDLALVQQKLAEDVAVQKAQVDAQDTNNLVGFVERRNDTGPDEALLMQLALEHGKSVDDAELARMRAQLANRRQSASRQRPRRTVAPRYGARGGGVVSLQPAALGINVGLPQLVNLGSRRSNYTPRETEQAFHNSPETKAALRRYDRAKRTAAARQRNLNRKHLTGERFIQPTLRRRPPLELGPSSLGPVYV